MLIFIFLLMVRLTQRFGSFGLLCRGMRLVEWGRCRFDQTVSTHHKSNVGSRLDRNA